MMVVMMLMMTAPHLAGSAVTEHMTELDKQPGTTSNLPG